MVQVKETETKEEITVGNINKLYFDLKQAQIIAGVSNQTLYTYAADTTNNISMVKFKGKNYLHKDDIESIRNEVEASKSIRNTGAITVKNKDVEFKELEEAKEQLDTEKENNIKLKNRIKELENKIKGLEGSNLELKIKNESCDKLIIKLQEDIVILREQVAEKENLYKKELQDRLNNLSTISDLREEVSRLKEVNATADALKTTIKTLRNEKDNLFKEQINTLINHNSELSKNNTELMMKFDRFIDSQQAFQIMLTKEKESSAKLIEEKNTNLISKLFSKKK